MSEVFLVDGARTPQGRYGGALASVRPDDLAALVVGEAVRRGGVPADAVDEVILGAANQAGEDNRDVARMAVLLAGLPHTVPGYTVNRLCASGLTAVASAAQAIRSGEAELAVAGGVESMTRAPWVMAKPGTPWARPGEVHDTSLGWRFTNPALAARERTTLSMGETAEEVAALDRITRAASDAFALRSHRRAVAAQEAGRFDREIVPVAVRDGEVTRDEGPRPGTTPEKLAALRPVFRPDGIVTAGSSSPLSDGAAALLVASEDAVRRHGLTPRARIVASASAGVEPHLMGLGPVPATHKALERAGWGIADLDAVEVNEAFAAQALAVVRRLGLDEERVNADGGAIALGHPLGCSGARILLTLLGRMEREDARRGLATLCVGVGQGVALLVERV
ncbi:thiolase family protein [Streptomyces clavuligerus]|uniref:Probable acetyl-CoA acetyltransferase n=1 Tax=Streptomyces clavuligerus TaxID=1901 RepID=E2Q1E5_STRCL|nr:acetyl-CoA C-acyltransferase [Streptomyces clavuligerus]ANW16906.1 beta-ketoadipyl CoA thiolase [Streptomyces clavuligerus]AXU11435.1 acetyl-CoA C-acyltransferase [Streptomyces clavuligerus]EFG10571.1 beta-ketoadipyl-CoA thiolase [Streptomyces clavuligerus]MBY6301253.1 acetyl-CoA C-acyltransferase [Streptomyces clavuligerus]QCS04307.1 acetyl-CoA C-acyltransferase [Streptomyces clavuligerus]